MNLQEQLENLFQPNRPDAQAPSLSSIGTPIDTLIDIVEKGGTIKTGIDIISRKGVLLIEKNALIRNVHPLLTLRQNGIFEIPINLKNRGGVWDSTGRELPVTGDEALATKTASATAFSSVPTRIREISVLRAEATETYLKAKANIRKTLASIQKSGGIFDMGMVEKTVAELCDFLLQKEEALSSLTRELFVHTDYLLNHTINVCTIGTTILRKFNTLFSKSIHTHLSTLAPASGGRSPAGAFAYYLPEEIRDISIGFFLHDIGKTALPESLLNKTGPLTDREFDLIKAHSSETGPAILEKNGISNPYIRNIVQYHHAALYPGEKTGYPKKAPQDIPIYVKICKIADCYDAMTSKRSYEEAQNPIAVVTRLFRTYARKDPVLQFILHAFVESVGIHPPGSILYLSNQQMAYVLDSRGPVVLPFADASGRPLAADPIDFGDKTGPGRHLAIDSRQPTVSPKEACQALPAAIRHFLFPDRI